MSKLFREISRPRNLPGPASPVYTHRSASTHDCYPSANNGIPTTGSVCASLHSINQAKQRAINEAKLLQRELDGEV